MFYDLRRTNLGKTARTAHRKTVSQYRWRPIAFCITQYEPGKPIQLTQTALYSKLKQKNVPKDIAIAAAWINVCKEKMKKFSENHF